MSTLVLCFFCSYVNGLIELYPELYDAEQGGTSSEHQSRFAKKWGSYSTIVELANGEIERIDAIIQQPLEKTLLLLAYKADKNFLETILHRESLKNMK